MFWCGWFFFLEKIGKFEIKKPILKKSIEIRFEEIDFEKMHSNTYNKKHRILSLFRISRKPRPHRPKKR